MRARSVALVTTGVIVGIIAGLYIGLRLSTRAGNTLAAVPPQGPATAPAELKLLQGENAQLRAQVKGLAAELAHVEDLVLSRPEPAPTATVPVSPGKGLTMGMAVWEIQRATLNNLRQISAARDQYTLENGKSAGSVEELVGPKAYIRALKTVDGEDYRSLSMDPAKPMTVVTPDGLTVTYDPDGKNSTVVDIPEEARQAERIQELERHLKPFMEEAGAAYQAANNNQRPPNPAALLPYFKNPANAQEYLGFIQLANAKHE